MAIFLLVELRLRLKPTLSLFSTLSKELGLDCTANQRLVPPVDVLRVVVRADVVGGCLQIHLSLNLLTLGLEICEIGMVETLLGSWSVHRIPYEHLLNEVDGLRRGSVDYLGDVALLEVGEVSSHLHCHPVALLPGSGRFAQYCAQPIHLVLLAPTWEQRLASEQLCSNAPHGKDVHWRIVGR